MTPAEFTTQFRYSEDIPTKKLHESDNKYEAFEAHNSLLITETISPIIFSSLERAAKNLLIDHKKINTVSYTHLRAHETLMNLVCRLLIEKNFFNDTATTEIYT